MRPFIVKSSWLTSQAIARGPSLPAAVLIPTAIAALSAAFALAVSYALDVVVVRLGAPDELLLWWNNVVIGVLTFLIVLAVTVFAQRLRREERARLEVIREVNHHVGNALQVVRLHQAIGGDPEMTAQVDDAITRIEWVLREVLPQVNAPAMTPPADGHFPWRPRPDLSDRP